MSPGGVAPDPARRARWQRAMVGCLYLGYASLMLGKLALVVGAPAMVSDPALPDFDTGTYGRLVAWGSIGAVVGKCVNGAVADRLGGRLTFLLVLGATVFAVAAMGSSDSVLAFGVLYTVMAFAKSACWPSMAVLIAHWFVPRRYGSVWGILSTSARFGTLLSMLFLGALLLRVHWRTLFFVVAAIVAANLVLSWLYLKERPRDVGLLPARELAARQADAAPAEADDEVPDEGPHPLDGTTIPEALRAFAASRRVWLICLGVGLLTIEIQAFTDFLPLYLKGSLGLEDGHAGMASGAFPAGCLVSVLAGGFLYDRLGPRGARNVLTGMLLASVASVAALAGLRHAGLGGGGLMAASMGILFLYGVLLAPAYYLPMGIFSIRFGGPHCGILIGLIDACGYFFAALFQAVAGEVAKTHGWGAFLGILGAVALAAALAMGAFLAGEVHADPAAADPAPAPPVAEEAEKEDPEAAGEEEAGG